MKIVKGFTLVEVLISVVLLGIIFTFLYSTLNSTKQSNEQYIQRAQTITDTGKLFQTFVEDLSQVVGKPSVIYGKQFDILRIKTSNSVYNIINPYVTYFVSKKGNTLVRTESLTNYDLFEKNDFHQHYIFGDTLSDQVSSFKVYYQNGFFNLLFRSPKHQPIILKLALVQ